MPVLPDDQIAAYARGATVGIESNPRYAKYRDKWNSAENIAVAVAVCLGESSGNTTAHNPAGAYGLWQIFKPAHGDLFNRFKWDNPADNAKMAYIVWADAGGSWRPWVVYTSGAYLRFLSRGRKAAGSQVPTPTEIPNPLDPLTDVLTKVNDAFKFFSDPANWYRVGFFLAGVVLLWIGLWKLTGMQNVAKAGIRLYSRGVVNPK